MGRCEAGPLASILLVPGRHLTGRGSEGQPLAFTTDDATEVTIWISPHDVMAYNNCNSLYRLTRDQARIVRHALYTLRPGLIGLED